MLSIQAMIKAIPQVLRKPIAIATIGTMKTGIMMATRMVMLKARIGAKIPATGLDMKMGFGLARRKPLRTAQSLRKITTYKGTLKDMKMPRLGGPAFMTRK